MSLHAEQSGIERLGAGEYRSRGADATARMGALLGGLLEAGDVVVLSGDLGAGKTCFTGGVAAGLGDPSRVTSPTFTIMCVHDGGRIPLYHFDLYRLEDAAQLDDVGIFDLLEADGACLIEWGELFADELGDERLELELTRDEASAAAGAEPARLLRVRPLGARAVQLAAAFDASVAVTVA